MRRPPRPKIFRTRREPVNAPTQAERERQAAEAQRAAERGHAGEASAGAAEEKPGKPTGEKPSTSTGDPPKRAGEQGAAGGRQPINGPSGKAAATAATTPPVKPPAEPGTGGRAGRRLLPAAIAVLVAGVVAFGVLVASGDIGAEREIDAPAPAPVAPESPEEPDVASQAATDLGFPVFATKNTTRVGGSDPIENAAAVALAVNPSLGESPSPGLVAVAPAESWPAAIAATVLSADPVDAPLLLSTADETPEPTARALAVLEPQRAMPIGDVALPEGTEATAPVTGEGAAGIAAEVARLRARMTGGAPDAYQLVPEANPTRSMPAAGWAARTGDPILFTGPDALPPATAELLEEDPDVPVYAHGTAEEIEDELLQELASDGRRVRRLGDTDPATAAVDFARYSDGEFGWDMNDPGHGLVIVRSERVLDAAAAARLSAVGAWGPLLLTDNPIEPPIAVRGFLLDIKPGYETDPTRALYNHVWIIGDTEAIGADQQATIDELAELEQIE